MCESRCISPSLKIKYTLPWWRVFSCCESICNSRIELSCPWISRSVAPVDCPEIVDDIPTSHDEDSLLAEFRKRLTELYVFTRWHMIIKAHTDNWYIVLREYMDECRPDSVIISTSSIECYRSTRIPHTLSDLLRYLWTPWCIIVDTIELFGESIHIVYHLWMLTWADACLVFCDPVSWEHEDSARPLSRLSEHSPCLCVLVAFYGIHRAPMCKEYEWCFCCHIAHSKGKQEKIKPNHKSDSVKKREQLYIWEITLLRDF